MKYNKQSHIKEDVPLFWKDFLDAIDIGLMSVAPLIILWHFSSFAVLFAAGAKDEKITACASNNNREIVWRTYLSVPQIQIVAIYPDFFFHVKCRICNKVDILRRDSVY